MQFIKKCFYKNLSEQGSMTVEASIALPLFLFAMFSLFMMGNCLRVKNTVYEAFQETTQYLAEYQYLYEMAGENTKLDVENEIAGNAVNTATAMLKLKSFIDDKELVDRYVSGGVNGVVVTKCSIDSDGFITLRIAYKIKVNLPIGGKVSMWVNESVRQKAYLGYEGTDASGDEDRIVYVAENGQVYHDRRSCTHISLSIARVSADTCSSMHGNLTPCEFCAKGHKPDYLYITDEGDRYHYYIGCSGLKRTVFRIKLSEVADLPPCSDCGN